MDKWYIVNNAEIIKMEKNLIFGIYGFEDIDKKNNITKIQKKISPTKDNVNDSWDNFIKFESPWVL